MSTEKASCPAGVFAAKQSRRVLHAGVCLADSVGGRLQGKGSTACNNIPLAVLHKVVRWLKIRLHSNSHGMPAANALSFHSHTKHKTMPKLENKSQGQESHSALLHLQTALEPLSLKLSELLTTAAATSRLQDTDTTPLCTCMPT